MSHCFRTALVVIVLLFWSTAHAQETVIIGVMEFTPKGGVSQDTAEVLADLLAEKITRMGDVRVITRSDILSMLDLESKKRLANCTDEECFAEVGGALGVRWAVSGNLGLFGETYLLNLKLIDIASAEVPSRVSKRIKGDEEALLDGLMEATHELFAKVADRLELIPTVTVASRHTQLLAESPSAVTVITRKEILSSGASTLADLLRRVPGFDIYELKPSFPLVGARALTDESNNLVLLLVDGREAMTEIAGFAFWNVLTFDLEEVERVEVIRGPGSALYGANAFAAVVSVTTVSNNPADGGDVIVSSGEQGNRRLFGRVRGTWDLEDRSLSFKVGLGAFGGHSPSDARDRQPDGFRSHGYARFREGDWLDLSLHAGMVTSDGILYVMMGDMRFSDAHNYWVMGKARVDVGEVARLKFQIYYTEYGAWFSYRTKLRAYDMWLADVPDIFLGTGTLDGQAQLDWQPADDFLIIFGGYLRYNFLDIDNMIIRETDEFRGAGYAQVQWSPLDAVQLIGGLRLDLNTSTEAAFSPRAAAVFRPWPEHHFRLGYGLAFRRPSYFENRLHSKIVDFNQATPEIVELAASQIGNEALVNEKVHSIEAGWRGRFMDDSLRVSVDLFLSFYRDTIVFDINVPSRLGLPDLSEATVRYENKGTEVNALGGEVELTWRPVTDWTLWGNLGFRHVTNIDTGERMPTEPRLRANLGVGFLPEAGPIVNIALHYVSTYRMPLMDPANILSNFKLVPLGDSLLAIGRAGYRLRLSEHHNLETGLTVRTPVGYPFREFAGSNMPSPLRIDTASDFGGEELVRLVSFYLRGTF